MTIKKWTVLLLATALTCSCVGCGSKPEQTDSNQGDSVTLTWWTPLFPHVAQTATNFGEVALYKELEKETGVNLEFVHPAQGQENEKFNIMLSSGEYPDLFSWNFTTYKGGPQKAMEDGVIAGLDDYLSLATNYSKILKEHPDWDKQTTTDEGKHYTFATFYSNDELTCWFGPQIRKDLLDKANLPLPETIDEWDRVLRAFKDMGVEYPLCIAGTDFQSVFSGAFGVGDGFYQENGIVKYGFCEPAYKDYVNLMRTWYQDGLLDPDFYAQDSKALEAKITSGKAGAYLGAVGGAMGKYIPVLKNLDSSYEISGTKFLAKEKGEIPQFGVKSRDWAPATSVSISQQCENKEAAVKFLDYGYTEKGHMLYNFGIEGVSYNMVDGYPKYTDEILKNPDGLSVQHAMGKYLAAVYGGPFVQDVRYFEQYTPYEEQKEAVKLWSQQGSSRQMPLLTFTQEETEVIVSKTTAVDAFLSEGFLKFVTGKTSMDEYDSFVQKAKSMGLDDMIQVYQTALERYNAKPVQPNNQ